VCALFDYFSVAWLCLLAASVITIMFWAYREGITGINKAKILRPSLVEHVVVIDGTIDPQSGSSKRCFPEIFYLDCGFKAGCPRWEEVIFRFNNLNKVLMDVKWYAKYVRNIMGKLLPIQVSEMDIMGWCAPSGIYGNFNKVWPNVGLAPFRLFIKRVGAVGALQDRVANSKIGSQTALFSIASDTRLPAAKNRREDASYGSRESEESRGVFEPMLLIVAGLSSALAGFLMMFYAARQWGVAAWGFALLFLLGSTSSGVGMIWLLGGDPPSLSIAHFSENASASLGSCGVSATTLAAPKMSGLSRLL
jgi:hypothetical protein